MSLFWKAYILIFILNILYSKEKEENFYIMNDKCEKTLKKDKIKIDFSNKFLLEIIHGKIPIKIEETTLKDFYFDIKFIEKINKNIRCPYFFNNTNYKNNKTKELYLGIGINIFNFELDEISMIIQNSNMKNEKFKYISFFEKIYSNNNTFSINDKIFENPFLEIDEFNIAILNYYINKFTEEFGGTTKFKTPYLNSFLSLYIQLNHKDIDFKKYINYNPTETSYLVEHLYETFPYVRFIQSKLLSMVDGIIRYNNIHIFFVVPLAIFDKNEINKIKDLVRILYSNLNNYKLNYFRISVLAYIEEEDDLKYLIDLNNNKLEDLEKLLEIQNRNLSSFIDLEKIYKNLNKIYKENENKNIYENKIEPEFEAFIKDICNKIISKIYDKIKDAM